MNQRFTIPNPQEEPRRGTALLLDLTGFREVLKHRYRSCLAEHALSEPQWRVLQTLAMQGPLATTRLAEMAAVQPSSLTNVLAGLEARNLVLARRDPDDARRIQLRLSAKARTLLEEMAPEVDDIEQAIADQLGATDMALLQAALRRARRSLSDDDAQPPLRAI